MLTGNLILTPPPLSTHPVDVGQRSEAAVIDRLVSMGHCVLVPVGTNHRYDFVVDVDGRFLRCQCKTGQLRNGAIRFSTRSVRCNTKSIVTRDYDGEIDYFLVYCPHTDGVYAVPFADAARGYGSIRVTAPANNQREGIRWAADYEVRPRRARRAAA